MKPTVLIIDDDPAQLALYSSWFDMEFPTIDWRVSRAPPTDSELTEIDAALIDYQLGTSSGADLARHWLSLNAEARIVLMSGHSRRQLEDIGEAIPDVQFLQKTEIPKLAAALGDILRQWQLLPAN